MFKCANIILATLLLFNLPLHAKQPETEFLLLLTGAGLCLALISLLLLLRTLQKRKHQLNRYRKQLQRLLATSPAMIALLDKHFAIQQSSRTWQSFFADNAPATATLALFADQDAIVNLVPTIKQHLQQQRYWQGNAWLHNVLGAVPFQLLLQHINEPEQEPLYFLFAFNIIEPQAQSQQYLQFNFRDPQTQLASKCFFEEQLSYSLQSCNDAFPQLAVIMLKIVPKTTQSDSPLPPANLKKIAQLLTALLPPGIVVARYDHDTLVMLLPPHLCQHNLHIFLNQLAYKIIHVDLADTTEQNHPYQLALGISISPTDGNTVSNLLANVVNATERAAMQPVSAFYFSDSAEMQQVPDLYALEQKLYQSAAQGEFTLFYLPKFSISSHRVIGFEALLRWPNQERGMLTPLNFLPLVESSGLISKLDRITFRKACQQVVFWQQTGLMRGRIAVNVSELHFVQPDFLQFLQHTLTEFELAAELFCLELPETLFKQPAVLLKEKLQILDNMGFKLILDNFGEGISSLTQLQHFPLHGVKLAASIVKHIEHNEKQRNLCATLIRLIGYLELEVIATHIETEMQAYLLHVMGCDSQQGHRFSRAIPAEDVGLLLLKENQILATQRHTAN